MEAGRFPHRLTNVPPIDRTTEQFSQTANGIWSLQNEIKLSPDQAQVFFDFLILQGRLLENISICDKQDAEEALGKVYRLIAAYGRKVREGMQSMKFSEISKRQSPPTTLPKGSYFTVSQAAQVCGATSKQIRAWVRTGKLEAIELPGLGIIIEIGKLNEFLC